MSKQPRRKPAEFAKFEAAYRAGEPVQAICTRLHVPKATADRWRRAIRVEIGQALRSAGLNEGAVADTILRLLRARLAKWNQAKERWDTFEDGNLQLLAAKELARLLDMYPAPKQETPPIAPVTLIFDTSGLVLPGEEPDYHNDTRTLDVAPEPPPPSELTAPD